MASQTVVCAFLITIVQFLQLSAAQEAVHAAYWFPDSGLDALDINSTLFTHLFYAFASLDNNTNQVTVFPSNTALFSQFTKNVKLKNPSVETLLSIGGGPSKPADYASMASSPASRKSFINSSFRLARSNNFIGLDLDWQYPLVANDMDNLGTLLDEWRVAAEAEANAFGKPRLLLTAAVSVRPIVEGLTYPVQSISKNLDWINVMAYDFYGPPWSPNRADAHAALYAPRAQVSGSAGVEAWIQAGVNAKKVVFGLPFYGYGWKLANPNNHGLLAPANGSSGGDDDGSRTYSEILDFIANSKATTVYNSTIVASYCYAATTWIGFDDKQSISAKVLYTKQKGLLGYFAWHVAADDNWALSQQAKQTWGLAGSGAELQDNNHDKQKKWMLIVWPIVAVIAFLLGSMMLLRRRVIKFKAKQLLNRGTKSSSNTLQVFSFAIIKEATNDFSVNNKIGEGGYGPVYKGNLHDGQEIAVKRLSHYSKQGLEEFENEVTLTAKLQHVNLVRLLGFCRTKEEKMLIYEFMPNKSLDFYLFEPSERSMLHWENWVQIIEGIIQGLLYLQEYSRLTIIHRDLKASNILLDAEMRPKIADFGIARSFQKDEHEGNTRKIVGTYGYVPPEYVKQGMYSRKYDVYSFGVILLQIISGKKCTRLHGPTKDNLLEYAYNLWKSGDGIEFVDPTLDDATSSCKFSRCMQVALLCVQESWMQRPTMLEISSMLRNETDSIPNPERPAFSTNNDGKEDKRTTQDSISVDVATISKLVPR